MSKKTAVATLSFVAIFVLTACVPKSMTAICTLDGAKYLSADASAGQICQNFEKRLDEALVERGAAERMEGLNIAIQLHKRGSAEVRVTRKNGDMTTEYPVVAIDVLDRSYEQKDLDKLAVSVAQLLARK